MRILLWLFFGITYFLRTTAFTPVFHGDRDDPMTPQILGVFYSEKMEKMGAGGTVREFSQKIYWFALQLGPSDFLVYPLDDSHLPLPVTKKVGVKEFIATYIPDPVLYRDHAFPLILDLQEKLLSNQECDALGKRLLKALGMAKKEMDVADSSEELARKIVAQASSDPHLLEAAQRRNINTLGIQLRKEKNFEGAINYYRKALDLNPADDHVHFNIARAYFDKGDHDKCLSYLDHALGINPAFEEAAKFRAYIARSAGVQAAAPTQPMPQAQSAPQPTAQPASKPTAQPASKPKAQPAPTPRSADAPSPGQAGDFANPAAKELEDNFEDINVSDFQMDRRKHPRLSLPKHGIKHVCLAQKDGASFKAALIDISRTGAKLLLPRSFEETINAGDVLFLDPRLPLNTKDGKPIKCVSRWTRDKLFGVMFEDELPLDVDDLPDILKRNKS